MTVDLTPTATPEYVTQLTQAFSAYRGEISDRPTPTVIVDALLQAEKAAKQQRLTYQFESLVGQWRLCFATGTRKVRKRRGIILGKGFYVPKFTPAYISFAATSENKGEIGNQIRLGTISLKLTGPAEYLGKKNLLAFDFSQMEISLFSRIIFRGQIRGGQVKNTDFYEQSIGKKPFFAFFLITEDLIAARGRGGGLALWIRENRE
jgi:hypothetical protein